jgi:hypothetical protein
MSEKKENPQQKPQQIELELSDSEALGTYTNLAMITHSPSEFVVDFISVMPGLPKGKVVKRMIMTPDHAKRLLNALADNVRKYEEDFGQIKLQEKVEVPINFRGQMGQA